ncbi:MAG: type II secretion system F family protein [Chlamydiia bacterium]
MPIFCYEGLDERGKECKKELWAESIENARDLLVRQGIWFSKVELKKQRGGKSLSLNEKILFFQDLYQLLKAGIVLFEAIDLIETKMRGQKGHPIFLGIKESLKRGKSFSKSLEEEKGSFDPVVIGMTHMGETSGQITEVTKQILDMLKKTAWLRKEVLSAVKYPAFLLTMASGIFVVLLCFLVPQLRELFSDQNLPLLTRMIIKASDFMTQYGLWVLACILLSGLSVVRLLKVRSVRLHVDRALYQVPLLNDFLKELQMARFSRTLFGLAIANVPLVEGLEMTKRVIKNRFFLEAIDQALERIHRGCSLANAFKDSSMISPLFCRMLETAEKSGELKGVLEQAAEIYEQRVDTSLKQCVGVIQPILIILIGLIVGSIMLGTLMPMTDIRSFMETT